MNLREIQFFHHLAESLHFGKTSQSCNISASALTRAIQRLEEEVGSELFQRDKRTVSLTSAGELFKEYADKALSDWRIFKRDLDIGSNSVKGEISIYCSVTAVYSLLPEILTSFRMRYPDVHVNIQTGTASDALQKVGNGEVDIVVAALPKNMPGNLTFLSLVETQLVCIAPKHIEGIAITDEKNNYQWEEIPMIMPERGLLRSGLDHWFKSLNISPNIYSQVSGNEAIIAMVRLGCGVGVVPRLVLDKSPFSEDVKEIENGPNLPPYTVGVCAANNSLKSPVLREFWNVCKELSVKTK